MTGAGAGHRRRYWRWRKTALVAEQGIVTKVAAGTVAALDLPLKVVIWDDGGTTRISYYSPDTIAVRHGLRPELTTALTAINPLTDALTSA
jgi:hypothetical protein